MLWMLCSTVEAQLRSAALTTLTRLTQNSPRSGRKRAKGEMNGKSANINSAARQIYPEGRPIPLTEVLCVFDADQVGGLQGPGAKARLVLTSVCCEHCSILLL